MDTINRADYVVLLETQFVQSVVEASFAFGFLKISIALSLLRFGRSKWYKMILWGLIGNLSLTFVALNGELTVINQQDSHASTPSSPSQPF